MNATAAIQKPKLAPAQMMNGSNFAFVANSNGFAAATYSVGANAYEVHELPGLPGMLVTPTSLFGIPTSLFGQTGELQAAAGTGNLEGYLFRLLTYLSAEAHPEDPNRQAARIASLANEAARSARECFNRTDDMGYSTDLRSPMLGNPRLHSTLKVKLSDQLFQLRYGPLIDAAIEQGFNGASLSNTHRHWLEDYIIDEVREVLSPEARTIRICCLSGPELQPTIGEFYIDGFVADQLKIEHDPWMPVKVGMGEALIFSSCEKVETDARPKISNSARQKRHFETVLTQLKKRTLASVMPPEDLAQILSEYLDCSGAYMSWRLNCEHSNPPPAGLESASSETLLEIAVRLAQAKAGASCIGDDCNVTSTFTATK